MRRRGLTGECTASEGWAGSECAQGWGPPGKCTACLDTSVCQCRGDVEIMLSSQGDSVTIQDGPDDYEAGAYCTWTITNTDVDGGDAGLELHSRLGRQGDSVYDGSSTAYRRATASVTG